MRSQAGVLALGATLSFLFIPRAFAAADELALLRQELEQTRAQVQQLEARLAAIELQATSASAPPAPVPAEPVAVATAASGNANVFNPAISAILQGSYNAYSAGDDAAAIAGFALGEEAGPDSEGFSLGESELNLAASVDPYFYGALTAALEDDAGETGIAVEEAYIETLSLPFGMKVRAGRVFPVFGYLNEIHAHADAFVDRPLPYRAFLGGDNYRDDGVQMSVLLPTSLYAEMGGGIYRGIGFPAEGSGSDGTGATTLFARVGGDIGISQSWLAGVSFLRGEAVERETDDLLFSGTTRLYAADAKYTWAPNGNLANRSLTLQAEYLWREEDGSYDGIAYDEDASGWYAQAVYKFLPRWKIGYRYSGMNAPAVPLAVAGTALDSAGHDPEAHSLVIEWDASEFSSLRLQYTLDDAGPESNDLAVLRYTMSVGAHGAHKY